jgi:hypothetical protein
MYGQSGSSPKVCLFDPEVPKAGSAPGPPGPWHPPTLADRVSVMATMYSHAASCASGDNTLPATLVAVREVVSPAAAAATLAGPAPEVPADDRFVFVLSDANLGRYGTDPKELASALTSDPRVHGYVLFIAEPSAADWLAKELPLGRGVVCMETSQLPMRFRELFAQAAAKNATAADL